MDEEYDVDGGLDMYESRKKKGTKVCLLCMLCAWHVQRPQFETSVVLHFQGLVSLVGWPKLVDSSFA